MNVNYRQRYLNEERRAARASVALFLIREQCRDLLDSGCLADADQTLTRIVEYVDAFQFPASCNVRMSCYSTCDRGTKGCPGNHGEISPA